MRAVSFNFWDFWCTVWQTEVGGMKNKRTILMLSPYSVSVKPSTTLVQTEIAHQLLGGPTWSLASISTIKSITLFYEQMLACWTKMGNVFNISMLPFSSSSKQAGKYSLTELLSMAAIVLVTQSGWGVGHSHSVNGDWWEKNGLHHNEVSV